MFKDFMSKEIFRNVGFRDFVDKSIFEMNILHSEVVGNIQKFRELKLSKLS